MWLRAQLRVMLSKCRLYFHISPLNSGCRLSCLGIYIKTICLCYMNLPDWGTWNQRQLLPSSLISLTLVISGISLYSCSIITPTKAHISDGDHWLAQLIHPQRTATLCWAGYHVSLASIFFFFFFCSKGLPKGKKKNKQTTDSCWLQPSVTAYHATECIETV